MRSWIKGSWVELEVPGSAQATGPAPVWEHHVSIAALASHYHGLNKLPVCKPHLLADLWQGESHPANATR